MFSNFIICEKFYNKSKNCASIANYFGCNNLNQCLLTSIKVHSSRVVNVLNVYRYSSKITVKFPFQVLFITQ